LTGVISSNAYQLRLNVEYDDLIENLFEEFTEVSELYHKKSQVQFSKNLRATNLQAILRNDFQSNDLNIEYHTKFIHIFWPRKARVRLFRASAFSTVHLYKPWLTNPEPFKIDTPNLL
jgi:hypothetical protein